MTEISAEELAKRFNAAAHLIDEADSLIIAAGAGMGVDSGLPDFRGVSGFWQAYPALGRAKIRFESIASPATFERDPSVPRCRSLPFLRCIAASRP